MKIPHCVGHQQWRNLELGSPWAKMQGQPSKGPFPYSTLSLPLLLFVTLSLELELGGLFTRGPPGLCPPNCYATGHQPDARYAALPS